MTHVTRSVAGAAAATTLSGAITAGAPAAGATFAVVSATGWPTANFVAVLDRGLATEEKIFCSSRSGTTITVGTAGRGFDGTAAASHSSGARVEHELDAAVLTALLEHVNTDAGFDHGTNYLQTVAAKGTTGDMSASAPGDTVAAGNTGHYADAGHRHAREAASASTGTVYFTNLGAALSQTFTAEADATGLTAITFTADGTSRYRLHLHAPIFISSSGGTILLKLKESSTLVGVLIEETAAAAAESHVRDGFWEWIPTAGSHTYKVTGTGTGASGARLDTFQSGGLDTYLSVEKIGTV